MDSLDVLGMSDHKLTNVVRNRKRSSGIQMQVIKSSVRNSLFCSIAGHSKVQFWDAVRARAELVILKSVPNIGGQVSTTRQVLHFLEHNRRMCQCHGKASRKVKYKVIS